MKARKHIFARVLSFKKKPIIGFSWKFLRIFFSRLNILRKDQGYILISFLKKKKKIIKTYKGIVICRNGDKKVFILAIQLYVRSQKTTINLFVLDQNEHSIHIIRLYFNFSKKFGFSWSWTDSCCRNKNLCHPKKKDMTWFRPSYRDFHYGIVILRYSYR